MAADDIAKTVGKEAALEIGQALARVQHCLEQLTDTQIWWRPGPELNSIGNLVLHLCGNVRQWLVVGLGGGLDQRDRPAEFAEKGPIPRAVLLFQLETTVAEAQAILTRQKAEDFMRVRRIQGFDVTGLAALFDSVPHFRGHTQEIIGLTRQQLGNAYRFFWKPKSPEQGG